VKRTAIKRKRATPRRKPESTCITRGCNRRATVRLEDERWCGTHATAKADTLFSLYIRKRDGKCQNCGSTEALQCSHHVTRGVRAVRWHDLNAVAHCAPCHARFTNHPALHHEWIEKELLRRGSSMARLLDLAYGPINPYTNVRDGAFKVDVAAVIADYRARLEEMA
jgi:hypothetical protein